jgi:hypothetical protein
MAVYVDRLRDWGWRWGPSCHLISDAPAGDNLELHAFAARLGLKRSWFQKSTSGPHYDLTASRRALAVGSGAVELGDHEFAAVLRGWRAAAVALLKAAPDGRAREELSRRIYS